MGGTPVPATDQEQNSAAVVCTSMCTVVEPRAQRSTVAQSPPHKAAYNQVRDDQRTHEEMYARICMLRPVCFLVAWGSSHLQVARLHLKCWTIYLLHMSVIPIDSTLRASVAGGTTARYAKRLVHVTLTLPSVVHTCLLYTSPSPRD